jgi:hypothetical protein
MKGKRLSLPDLLIFLFLLGSSGCERGCAKSWLGQHGVGKEVTPQAVGPSLHAIDCPDGLARCNGGLVEVSRLASVALPCKGPVEQCTCPWVRLAECDRGCVADGLDIVAERAKAARQLCAPNEGGEFARPERGESPGNCDDDQLYRCLSGAIVSCAEHAVVGKCIRGCFVEGGALEGDVPIGREAAFAILCSR